MKRYESSFNHEIQILAARPIRVKADIIKLLLKTIQLMISKTGESECAGINRVILYIDKMSRLVYCMDNKMFSINFPFFCRIEDMQGEERVISISDKYGFEFNGINTSALLAIFNDGEIIASPLADIMIKAIELIQENGWDSISIDDLDRIIKLLIDFEPGYLRYDCDPEHANGTLHPLNHFDFYYSSSNQVKVGLKGSISESSFIDFLDTNTNCNYLDLGNDYRIR